MKWWANKMTELQQNIYNEAIRIGDQLCSLAKTENGNYYWETLQSDLEQNTSWGTTETLYSGTSGVALYLLELYSITENKTYLEYALSHAKWLDNYCKENKAVSWAFLTGRTGISYFFLRLYQITKKQEFLTSSSQIVDNCAEMTKSDYLVDDYINGAAGVLSYLVKLYHYTKSETLLASITTISEHLFDRASVGEKGLYWDKSEKQKFGLCGFSHGVSGVAFSLLELGKATGNNAFYWLAEYALQYEGHHYIEARKNWPDFRHGIYKESDYEEQKEKLLENDINYFQSGGDMNAWCHGAMGIGLTRKRAYQLLDKNIYKDELQICIEKTRLTTNIKEADYVRSFTLCHGGGGNADVYIQAYLLTKDKSYLTLAEEIAEIALEDYKKEGTYYPGLSYSKEEDTSLYMGTAGIGYFYLRTLFPEKVTSILALEYTESTELPKNGFLSITKEELLKRIAKKEFPKTAEGLSFSLEPEFPTMSQLYNFIKGQASDHAEFDRENAIYTLSQTAISASHTNVSELYSQEQGKAFLESESDIETVELVLSERMKLYETADERTLMLSLTPVGVTENELSSFSYVVLASFEKKNTVNAVLPMIYEMFETSSEEENLQVKTAVIDQVKSAIRGGVLLTHNH